MTGAMLGMLRGWRRAAGSEAWYAPLLAMSMAIMLVRLLLLAQILDVLEFARLNAGLLVSISFAMFGCFGLHVMLQRDWPVLVLRKRLRRAMVLALQCALIAVVIGSLGALGALGGVVLPGTDTSVLLLSLVHGVAGLLFLVASTESRSRGQLGAYSRENLVRSTATFLLGAMSAAVWGTAFAVLAAEAVVSIVYPATLLRRGLARAGLPSRVALLLAVRRLRYVPWRSALALLGVSMFGYTLFNADRWLAALLLDPAQFANYSFAAILLAAAQGAQSVVNTAVFPKLVRRYAESGPRSAFTSCAATSLTVLSLGAVVAAVMLVPIRYAIQRWYPEYASAGTLVPVLLGVCLFRVSDFWSGYLVAAGAEAQLLAFNLVAAVAAVALWVGIYGAWPVSAAQVSMFALLLSASVYATVALLAWRRAEAEGNE